MNKKQSIVAWVVGIAVCIDIFRALSDIGFFRKIFYLSLSFSQQVSFWQNKLIDIGIYLILGAVLIHIFRDKKTGGI
jgi:hypothetical protein